MLKNHRADLHLKLSSQSEIQKCNQSKMDKIYNDRISSLSKTVEEFQEKLEIETVKVLKNEEKIKTLSAENEKMSSERLDYRVKYVSFMLC